MSEILPCYLAVYSSLLYHKNTELLDYSLSDPHRKKKAAEGHSTLPINSTSVKVHK